MTSPHSEGDRCESCGRYRDEIHYSDMAHAYLCLWCYSKLPGARWRGPEPSEPAPPPRPKPDTYGVFVSVMRERLEKRTGHTVFHMSAREWACYCPACRTGTMTVTLLDLDEPRARVTHRGVAGCSAGCTPSMIGEAMR